MKTISTPNPLIFLFILLLTITQNATATVRYVKAGATGGGTSWSNASGNLQSMLNASLNGDEVWVAEGDYKTADNQSFVMMPGVKIYGGFTGTETNLTQRDWVWHTSRLLPFDDEAIIQNNYNGLTNTALLDGFTIANALQTAVTNYGSSPTFNNCTFSNNTTTYNGGGMYNSGSSPLITNCYFSYNAVNGNGGGMYNTSSSSTIINCSFTGNSTAGSATCGGGLYDDNNSSSKVTSCSFTNNISLAGGGICSYGNSVFIQCTFKSNTAYLGGAINTNTGSAQFINCLISGNRGTHSSLGTAIANVYSAPTFINCTIAGNQGSTGLAAIWTNNGSGIVIRNSVIYNNSSGISTQNTTATISNSLIQGQTTTSNGNISGNTNPLFVSPVAAGLSTGGDYRLQACSPAINQGNSSYFAAGQTPDLSTITTELNYAPRIQGTAVDMGAYEFSGSNNGNPTGADLLAINYDAAVKTISGSTSFIATNTSCRLITTLQATGSTNALTGSVNTKAWIEIAQPANYVKRHYQVTPASNAANATGRATLYFTQAEFDAYNAVNANKLPTSSTDAAGKSILVIKQYTGASSNTFGLPNTYTAGPFIINPNDNDIVWNATYSRWEVTFDFAGYSGFFLATDMNVLPLNLLNFNGRQLNGYNQLQWETANEVNVSHFILERSTDGNIYNAVATITAGSSMYSYKDNISFNGKTYYRLKMVDKDGQFTYSPIVTLTSNGGGAVSIYPNPTNDKVTISTGNELLQHTARLYDVSGQLLQTIQITNTLQTIPVQYLKSGLYLLQFDNGTTVKFVKR